MKFIVMVLISIVSLCLLTGPAVAREYQWTGFINRDWTQRWNWHPDPGANNWPGKNRNNADAVVVPPRDCQPVIYHHRTGDSIYLLSLKIAQPRAGTNSVTTVGSGAGHVNYLFIMGVDGLVVERNCLLRLDDNVVLHLEGGGALVSDGRIENIVEGASLAIAPHTTIVTKGSGCFRGNGSAGGLFDVLHISSGVLVLGPGNQIKREVHLYSQTVNHGVIDPYYDGGPGGAKGCSYGWSEARRKGGEAEPVGSVAIESARPEGAEAARGSSRRTVPTARVTGTLRIAVGFIEPMIA
ncbi:MAG: hypothetical protein C4547_00950 [Phycisphaerales bacterium]|nr:MAG: hypothetical protein C4547_00950 [Phycisphaerales bacterium]